MTEPIIDDAVQKTMTAIETIAPKAWEMLVRAQRIDAELVLVTRSMWILFMLSLFLIGRRALVRWKTDDYDKKMKKLLSILLTIVAGGFIIGLLCDISGAIATLINPEVYAAQTLIHR